MADEASDPTRVPGAPHPRETAELVGQDAPQTAFLDAFNAGRLHHAWLITGPRGVGKATLAWRIARFLLATPDPDPDDMFGAPVPASLNVSPDHPVARRIEAGSEPGLKSVHRSENEKTKRLRDQIRAAKKDKIDADQVAMPQREELGTEKAAFAATTATVLGGLVALTGTTVLSEFVDISSISAANKFLGLFDQIQFFVAVDVLFTALILAGGSDGIHQIVKGFLSARDEMALT